MKPSPAGLSGVSSLMKPSPAGLSGVSSFTTAGALGGGGLTGAAVAAGDAAGVAPSQSGVPDEAPVAGLKSRSLPLNDEVVAKWSMKPSPAGLSGVSSFTAAGVLGGGGLTGAAVAGAGV